MRIGAEHVELSSFAPGVCQRANASTDFNCTSRCSQLGPASWPRFFEQLGKHAECFRMLNAHEKAQNFRYAWVTKMRSDPNIAVEYWMEPKYLRAAISQLTSATQLDNPTILTSPYIHGRCYSWSDWFVLVPRRLAHRYFNMVHELKCDWLQCAASAYTAKRKELSPLSDASEIHDWLIHRDGACLYNERLLVEWLYSGTQRVNVTPASQHILLPNRSSKCWHGRNGTGTGRMEWLEEQASLINGWPGRTTVSKLLSKEDRDAAGGHMWSGGRRRVDVRMNGMGRSVSLKITRNATNNSPTPCTNLSSPHLKARTDTQPLTKALATRHPPSRAHIRLSSSHRYLPMATSGSTVRLMSSITSSGAPRRPAM